MPLTPFQAPAAPAPSAPRPPGLPEALLRFRRQLDEPAWCGGPAGLVLRLQAPQDGLDLQLAAGQLVLVTGLPGSGKSHLLRQLQQHALADGWRHDLQHLGPPGSGPDGLRSWRRLLHQARGADRQQAAQQALRALQAVGLGPVAQQRVWRLPPARRHLAALALALARPAPALLLDEPLAGQPPSAAAGLRLLVRHALRHSGSTLVLATRQPAAWLDLADRVLLLEGGAVTCDAPVPLPRSQQQPVLALLRQRLLLRLKQAGLDLHIQS